jgi:hypothetical protein
VRTGDFHGINGLSAIMVLISIEYYARIAFDYNEMPVKNQAALSEARTGMIFQERR